MRLEPTDEASLLVLVDSFTWTAGWRRLRETNPWVREIFIREGKGIPPRQPNMDQVNPDNETPTIDFHYPFVSLAMHMAMAARRSQHYHRKGASALTLSPALTSSRRDQESRRPPRRTSRFKMAD